MDNRQAPSKLVQKTANPIGHSPQQLSADFVGATFSGTQADRVVNNTHRLLPSDVVMLQRAIGNQATARLLQRHPQPSLPTRLPSPPAVQRNTPVGIEGGTLDTALEGQLNKAQSGGTRLPNKVRRALEPQLDADLSQVKVHTDRHANQLNRDLGAKAFTHQNHIFYGKGQSPNNLQLTAHETVHTIQQGAVHQGLAQRTSIAAKPNAKRRDENPAKIASTHGIAEGEQIHRTFAPPTHITTMASLTPRVQRLSTAEESSLMTKMGRPKFQKAKTAGKLDFFFAKSDSELDLIRVMPHGTFDTMLSTASSGTTSSPSTTSPSTTSTTPSTPSTTPQTPQGKLAWLFEKVQNGAIAFINSAKYAFSTETLLPKLISGLTGKLSGEISSEALKLEVSGLQIPLGTLANTEFDMKLAAKLADQEAPPTTTGEKLSSMGSKAVEGAELDDLVDTSMGVKSEAETGFSFSTSKLMKGMVAPQKNLKLMQRPTPSTSGTTSPGIEFSGEGSVGGKIKLLFGWLSNLANKYIGEPLRALELKVKEDLLSTTDEEGAQQSTLGWLGSKTGSLLGSVGSMMMSGLSGVDSYLGGYGKSVVSKTWDWSTWAAGYVPEWVRQWMPSFDKEGLKKWFADRTKFLEKLDPNNAMPKLGGAIETKGNYVGPLQVEDMDTNVSLDLNIPESYLATWAKEIQEQFFPDSNLAQILSGGLGGKISLFRLQGYSFSRAKGFRGLIPSIRIGPAFNSLWNLLSRAASFVKQGASSLFHAVFG